MSASGYFSFIMLQLLCRDRGNDLYFLTLSAIRQRDIMPKHWPFKDD